VLSQVRSQESRRVLERLLASLPVRTQQILASSRQAAATPRSASLGVSKQAVHKAAAAALDSLREQLAAQGFGGLDSQGFLRTATRESSS
jgi:DNA-directed RNA polymerase specialized sigma24 family protein